MQRCFAPRRRLPPPPRRRRRRSRRQVSPSTRLHQGTWRRRSWAGSCSTGPGARTMAGTQPGSAAPSPVSARAASSSYCTCWRTRARRRRCAARRTHCLALPPTCSLWACAGLPLASWPGPVSGPPTPTLSFSLLGGSSHGHGHSHGSGPPGPSAKCGVHIYAKYAKYAPMHILAYSCIFLANFIAYQVHISACFVHVFCIFSAYFCIFIAYFLHISACKVHIRCIFLAYICIFYICIFCAYFMHVSCIFLAYICI
jgi:hypothetical protein